MQRKLRWLAVLMIAALVVAACGGDDGDDPAADPGVDDTTDEAGDDGTGDGDGDRGTIRLGFANEVPYGYEEGGEPTGQAPEVAKVVLDEMGYSDVEGEIASFDALINGLNAGAFDIIAAGMFITRDRASQALFTDPDYCGTTAFAVEEGNPLGLTDFDSVTESGADLGVLSGAVEDDYAVDSGVPDDQIHRFPDTADLVDALTGGIIDAFALTTVTVTEQTEALDGYEPSDGFVPVIDGEEQLGCGGYVFSFDNQDLRDEFNEILVEMRENDEIHPIIEEFGFPAEDAEAAKGVTVEDLIGEPYDFGIGNGG